MAWAAAMQRRPTHRATRCSCCHRARTARPCLGIEGRDDTCATARARFFNPDLSLGRAMMASRISSRLAHARRAHRRADGRDQPAGRRTPRSGGPERSEGWASGPQARARRCRKRSEAEFRGTAKAAARARAGRDDAATGCCLHTETPAAGAGRPNGKSGLKTRARSRSGERSTAGLRPSRRTSGGPCRTGRSP
jgi:hypothetical protein